MKERVDIVEMGDNEDLSSRNFFFCSCLGGTEHFLCLKSAKNKSDFFFLLPETTREQANPSEVVESPKTTTTPPLKASVSRPMW
ncbi:hypothetical protein QYF36_006143 [Acer negundo]|nr:hypothetical protein QYF36_006143 [Acer negundo]